jgi:penicillin-binding protein 1A
MKQERAKNLPRFRKTFYPIIFILLSLVTGVVGAHVYWNLTDLPAVAGLEHYAPSESSKVLSEDGKLLGEFYTEKRTFVPLKEIPQHVRNAFIAIEDERFYQHHGVDIIGILRALWTDLKARSVVQGGSTITQQLAKMLFLTPDRSLERKLKEAALALEIEKRYTKDEILELYLNQTFFGAGAYGIESASQIYFGISAKDLSIKQAALLAGLPKAPSAYNPLRHFKRAEKRSMLVLSRMEALGYINPKKKGEAKNEKIVLKKRKKPIKAPYFFEYLRQKLELKYGDKLNYEGLTIYSTLNIEVQRYAEEAVIKGIERMEKRGRKGVQAALIAVDIKNGHIRAMVGGKDFWESQFNRATQAVRQPGSAFKPIVYLAALEKGYRINDIVFDTPLCYEDDGGRIWMPHNYSLSYRGPVTLKTALAKSINTIAIQLLEHAGIKFTIKWAKDLGITTSTLQPYLPLALGASGVTLIEMVQVYNVFASHGLMSELTPYTIIRDRKGIVIERVTHKVDRVIDKDVARQMDILLKEVIQNGTGRRAKKLGPSTAGKTGTTNNFSDAWFIGYTNSLTVGVWVGKDNHKSIGKKETGSAAALPIWIDFLEKVKKSEGKKDKITMRFPFLSCSQTGRLQIHQD